MRIEEWYKSIVEGNSEVPPELVWDGIEDALDVDLVWSRIEADLNVGKKKHLLANIAIAASILLAVVLGGALYFQLFFSASTPQIAQKSILSLQRIDLQGNNDVPAIQLPEISEIHSYSIVVPESRQLDKMLLSANSADTVSIDIAEQYIANRVYPISSISTRELTVFRDQSIVPIRVVSVTDELADVANSSGVQSIYVGFAGHLANTWLLSSKTFAGLQPDNLTATNVTFGSSIGMQLGAQISQSLKLQSEFFWLNQNKQQYNEYINGKYVTNEFEINYYTFTLQGKYRFPAKHTLALGGYFGLTNTAKQYVDNEVVLVDDEYSDFDYGLIIGYEYPISLGRRFTFSPGVFAKVGLNNIFAGNEFVPYYLNKTQNASFNLSLSLAYNIF